MYPNLNAEMARRNITGQILSEKCGISYAALAPKIRGDVAIRVNEALKIRDAIDKDLSIDYLFVSDDTQ